MHALRSTNRPASPAACSPTSCPTAGGIETIREQFYVILECRDEKHQVELLKRFAAEGFKCKAALA